MPRKRWCFWVSIFAAGMISLVIGRLIGFSLAFGATAIGVVTCSAAITWIDCTKSNTGREIDRGDA